jgi:predicted RNase H-like HicB family nuclease
MSAFVDNIVSGRDLTFNLEFQRDEESGWFAVHVVELPGCVSQGATIEEAKTNIANALEMYMAVLLETAVRNEATREVLVPEESQTAKLLVRPRFEVRA